MNQEHIHKKVKIAHILYGMMMGLLSIFGIVFFYTTFGENLFYTFSFFGVIYLVSAIFDLLVPFVIPSITPKYAGMLSMVLYAISALALYGFSIYTDSIFILVTYSGTYALARALYQNVFQNYLMETAQVKNLGHDIGGMFAFIAFSGVLLPSMIGYLSDLYGPISLVILLLILNIICIFIYASLPHISYKTKLRLKDIRRDRTYRQLGKTAFWAGVYGPVAWIWSIALFIYLGERLAFLGVFIAALNLVASIGVKVLGNKMDKSNKKALFGKLRISNSIELLLKGISSIHIAFAVIADLYGRLNDRLYGVVFNIFFYSWVDHHEQKTMLDERITLGQAVFNLTVGMTFLFFGIMSIITTLTNSFILLGLVFFLGFLHFAFSTSKKQ